MYKAQFKADNAFQSWTTIGNYSSEAEAISVALRKQRSGVLMVRVVDREGNTIFSG